MTDEDIRRIVEDAGAYDESREGTLLGMLGDFYGRQMRSMAILVWANGLVALALAAASAVLFFQTDQIKQEILYAATFLTGGHLAGHHQGLRVAGDQQDQHQPRDQAPGDPAGGSV